MRLRTVLVLSLVAFALTACHRRGGRPDARTGLALMPRVVRESVHRDYAYCGGRDVRGIAMGNGQYRIVACGLDVVYQCPVGRHSRWRRCDRVGTVAAATVPASYAQPAPAPAAASGGTVTVITVTGSAGGQVYTTDGSAGATATATAPAATAPAATAPTTSAPAPTREQVETGIRGWLDSQRTAILSCTQTEAALVDVAWTAEGTPGIALGGELHSTAGEQCVVAALGGVRFNTGGTEGTLRHVIQ